MVFDYLKQQQARLVEDLRQLLRQPSVAVQNLGMAECAALLWRQMADFGMAPQLLPTDGFPVLYSRIPGVSDYTVLIYGHYDVQPVDDEWHFAPWGAEIDNGRIYGRGAVDDKGAVMAALQGVRAYLATGTPLPVSVIFLIEGEEEIGSPNLGPYVKANAQALACDCVAVSDTAMFAPGKPSIVYGLRGLAYLQIDVQGANRDLHSGAYGGAVQNPLNALATIISKLKDEHGRIQIPGFYDQVEELTVEERDGLNALGYTDQRLKDDVQVDALFGEEGFTTIERLGARPTLDVCGMVGGFTGEGAKTVLPAKAMAKVSMRLVPHQRTADISKAFADFVHAVAPAGVRVTVTDLHGADPVLVRRDAPAIGAAVQALEETFGEKCRFTREGGSIPVVQLFDAVLKAPTVLMGFGLNTENLHSPNEHFHLANFHAGMRAAARFYTYVASA